MLRKAEQFAQYCKAINGGGMRSLPFCLPGLALNYHALLSPMLALQWGILSHRLSFQNFKHRSFRKYIFKYSENNGKVPFYVFEVNDA